MTLFLIRVKSGNFGHQINSDSDLVSFIVDYWNEKNKLTKITVKSLMRRLLMSRLIWISTVCKGMSELPDVQSHLTLP